jgi:FemAB-related protein (PEP-CTERM system-associated)
MNMPVRIETALPTITVSDGISDADCAAFLAATPGSTPFHSAAWGRAVESATGHRWHLLVACDASGAILGILPLHHIRSALFGSALVSTGFAVNGGILSTSAAATEALATTAIDLAKDLGLRSVDLRGGEHPAGWSVDSSTYTGFSRQLAPSRDDELAAIPRKHRAEVRKALANDLTVTIGQGRADRNAHFHAYATSVRNLGTPVFPRRLFDCVLAGFGDKADILTIRHNGEPLASVLSLYWQGSVMPYWGGGTTAARSLRANERMYFELMDHARARGMTHFDFGRSKAGTGPAAYKKNWGFEPAPLAYARWTADGTAPRDTNPTSAKYKLMVEGWQRLPLWMANRLGPLISRQLG